MAWHGTGNNEARCIHFVIGPNAVRGKMEEVERNNIEDTAQKSYDDFRLNANMSFKRNGALPKVNGMSF